MTESVNLLSGLRRDVGVPGPVTGQNSLTQTDFLKLLTEQLKNQDPTDPLKNEEFVAQMAQFSTLSAVEKLSTGLDGIASRLDGSRVATAASLIGKTVLVPGGVAVPDAAGGIAGAIDLPAAADKLVVTIRDAGGGVVRTLDLGAQKAGLVGFDWNGRDAAGAPVAGDRFRVEAYTIAKGKQTAAATNVVARVESVALGVAGTAPALGVAGVGRVELDRVRQIGG